MQSRFVWDVHMNSEGNVSVARLFDTLQELKNRLENPHKVSHEDVVIANLCQSFLQQDIEGTLNCAASYSSFRA